jgi:Ricin-type beta-trefoil lectin domain
LSESRPESHSADRVETGKCMTAVSNTDGAAVTLQTCTGADSQKWTFDSGSVKVFGSKCLDVVGGQNVDGTKLQIWTCSTNQDPSQQFFYTGDYRLSWANHGKCTDLPNGSLNDGNQVSTHYISTYIILHLPSLAPSLDLWRRKPEPGMHWLSEFHPC